MKIQTSRWLVLRIFFVPLIYAAKQMEKSASLVIEGEALDVLVGTRRLEGEEKENQVKNYILKLLKDRYDIEEADFVSAELEIVPAGKARDFGLDASMIMAYGRVRPVSAPSAL